MTTLRPAHDRQLDDLGADGGPSPADDGPSPADDTYGKWQQWVGWAAVVFSFVYWFSDLTEVVQGDFSTARLGLTYAGEAAIPLFVLGLYAAQRPRIGRMGLLGAVAYAYSYVFFTCTVMYALVARTPDYRALSDVFGLWMVVHGAIMVLGGVAFGLAIIRAADVPRWTGACLMVGVVFVAAASNSSNLVRTIAATLPAAAFTGMGWALIRRGRPVGSRYFLGGNGKKPLVRRM